MAVLYPFSTQLAPIIIGTGDLFITEDGDEVHMGNFSIVDLVKDASAERVFYSTSDRPGVLGHTSAIRLEASGDSFSNQQMARLFNSPLVWSAGGDRINLATVEAVPATQFRFEKDVSEMCQGECILTVLLWHAYVDTPNTLGFNQDEPTNHAFNIIALPDSDNHPLLPYGYLEFSCPVIPS